MINRIRQFFRRSDETREPQQESVNVPDASSVIDAHVPYDEYDDLQNVINDRETYSAAAEFVRPKTFVEKNKWMKPAAGFGIFIGHAISALTAIGFSALAAYHFTNVNTSPTWPNIATALATGLVLLVMVILSETGKIKGEGEMFTAMLLRRKFPLSRKIIVLGLIFLSLATSSGGGYLAGLYYSDNTAEIEDKHQYRKQQSVSTFKADSTALETRYKERLQADRQTIQDWKKSVADLRNEKVMWQGRLTMPERNRKPANLLLEKITAKEDEISAYTEVYENDRKGLKTGGKNELSSIETELKTEILLDEEKAFRYGMIAIVIVIVVELISLVSHYMKAWFLRGAYLEGRASNMIEFQERGERITADTVIAEYQRKRARELAREMNRLKTANPQQIQAKSDVWDTLLDDQNTGKLEVKNTPEFQIKIDALERQIFDLSEKLKNPPNSDTSAGSNVGSQNNQQNYIFEQGTPNTTGYTYDVTPNEMRQIKKIKKAYEAIQKDKNNLPTMQELSNKSGIRSKNTIKKYLEMMQLKTLGQQ
ncbi:MAG: hypothetical protein SF052_15780 [Bacteroidia bacterium]|nr:hypothetical protein [Bacteroidia bacterium]